MLGIARFLGVVQWNLREQVRPFRGGWVRNLFLRAGPLFSSFGSTGIKRLMAYSSVEHIGVQALGLGFGGPLGIAGAL